MKPLALRVFLTVAGRICVIGHRPLGGLVLLTGAIVIWALEDA